MKCVLHIGTEKTGTTALQSYLFDHQNEFSDAGVHVCSSLGQRNNRLLAQAMMACWRRDDFWSIRGVDHIRARKAWRRSTMSGLGQEVAYASRNHHVFVISSEHFHSRLALGGEVQMLARYMQSLFDEVEVVCYLRRQDRMAISLYSTALRAGHAVSSILPMEDSLPRTKYYFDYERLLERWAGAFGKEAIIPRIYDDAKMKSDGIIRDFLELIGVEMGVGALTGHRINSSLSAEAQGVLEWSNSRLSDRTPEEARAERLVLSQRLQALAPGKPSLPSRAEVAEFMQFYEQSNANCARAWFDREALFSEDYSEYPEEAFKGDPTRIAELIQYFSPGIEKRSLP